MKKLWIILPLVLILAFAACILLLTLSERNQDATEPDTQATTTPVTQPTQPDATETTAPPTEPVVVQPAFSDIEVFIHGQYEHTFDAYLTDCKEGHLYYYYHKTNAVTVICDEPVVCFASDNVNLYFVKKAEATKLYCAPQTDLGQQTAIYESEFGDINYIWPEVMGAYADRLITLTEGNKRGVLLDLETGEITVVLEQYYLEMVRVAGLKEVDGKLTYDKVWFRGKLNEGEETKDYYYWVESGEITEDDYC